MSAPVPNTALALSANSKASSLASNITLRPDVAPVRVTSPVNVGEASGDLVSNCV